MYIPPRKIPAAAEYVVCRVKYLKLPYPRKGILHLGPAYEALGIEGDQKEARELYKNGRKIEITQVEFLIIRTFFKNVGKAMSREEITKMVWGENYQGDPKIVDVNMRRLRIKIEDDPAQPKHINTIWGFGYRWEA